MLVGYNHNIRHKDKLYHVQTEDTGSASLNVVTLLYSDGTIIASKKTDYSHLVDGDNFEPTLKTLMQAQHKELLYNLRDGQYDGIDETGKKVEEPIEVVEEAEGLETLSVLDALKTMEEVMLSEIMDKTKDPENNDDEEPQTDRGFDEVILDYLSKGIIKKSAEKDEK
ncbi:hypothetical protein ACFL2A_02415 [Thermodesulfobacteriota bacterium]